MVKANDLEKIVNRHSVYWGIAGSALALFGLAIIGGIATGIWKISALETTTENQKSTIADLKTEIGTMSDHLNDGIGKRFVDIEKQIAALDKTGASIEMKVDFLMSRVFPIKLQRKIGIEGPNDKIIFKLKKPIDPKDVAETLVINPIKGLTFKTEFNKEGTEVFLIPNDPSLLRTYSLKAPLVTLYIRLKKGRK